MPLVRTDQPARYLPGLGPWVSSRLTSWMRTPSPSALWLGLAEASTPSQVAVPGGAVLLSHLSIVRRSASGTPVPE